MNFNEHNIENAKQKGVWIGKNCDFSATTFKGRWFIMYTKEPSGEGRFFCYGVMHMETNVIILGDCLDVLRELPDNSIDNFHGS